MKHLWVAMMLAAVALAGCSDDKPDADDDDAFDDIDLGAGKDTGVIRGIVVDLSIVPVEGATITLVKDGQTTTSNAQGAFGFGDLPPGTYFLKVSKLGWKETQQSVEVVAGIEKPPIVKVLLEQVPGAEPFVVPYLYQGFISCGFKTFNIVWDASTCDPTGHLGYADRDDSQNTFEYTTDRRPEHFQAEIDWDFSQPLSSGLVAIICNLDNAGCGSGTGSDRICNVRGTAPLICAVNKATPSDDVPGGGNNFTTISDGDGPGQYFTVGMFSNCAVCYPPETPVCVAPLGIALACPGMGFGLSTDQKYDLYVNLFYNFSPDDGWTFLEDGAASVPGK